MKSVVARELKSMNPSQIMFVYVCYFLEPNNLAGKQVLGLKGSWRRQVQACNCHPKDQESWVKPVFSCFQGPDFFSRVSKRSGSSLIFNFNDRGCLEPGHWIRERNLPSDPRAKAVRGLSSSSQCLPEAPAEAAQAVGSPQLGPRCSFSHPHPHPRLSGRQGCKGPAGVGREAKCLVYIL